MNTIKFFILSSTALILAASSAQAQGPRVLVREDDPLGPAGHIISAISTPSTNNVGGFGTTLNTTDGTATLSHIWGNAGAGTSGAILRTETLGIGGFDQTAFESGWGMDDTGSVCYSPTLTDTATMTTGIDACWVDGTAILNELDNPITEPMLVSRFNSRPAMIKGTGEPVWIGGLDDMGGTDVGRRLYRGAGHTIVQQTGPAPAPLVAMIPNGGVDFDYRFSTMGTHWINQIDTDLATAADGFMVIDGALAMTSSMTIIGEGEAIPGLTENWDNFDNFGINEAGDFMITGDTDGDTATDEYVSLNGDLILREGDTVSDAGGTMYTLAGSIDMASMNESGDIGVVWDVDATNNEAVLLNGVVILKEGDEVDWDNDGVTDPGHIVTTGGFGGLQAISVSSRSGGMVQVYVTADIDVPMVGALEGLICINVPVSDPYPSMCIGDGGDQMGCTNCPCSNNAMVGSGGGCLNSAGTGSRLIASGSSSVSLPMASSDDLRFEATDGPANQLFILNTGDALAPTDPANPCFGTNSGAGGIAFDGLRCAVVNTLRNGGRGADMNGEVGVTNAGWGGADNPPGGIAQFFGYMSGQVRYFQGIHRDDTAVNCGTGLNTTQAICVTFTP